MNDAIVLCKRIAQAAFAARRCIHHTSKSDARTGNRRPPIVAAPAAKPLRTSFHVRRAAAEGNCVVGFPANHPAPEHPAAHGTAQTQGRFAGTHYFERTVLHVAAIDPREPAKLATETATVAILAWISPPVKPGVDLDAAHRALWDEHQTAGGKGKFTRGEQISGHLGSAVQIVMEQCKCDRPAAEAAVDELAEQKRVTIKAKYRRRQKRQPTARRHARNRRLKPPDDGEGDKPYEWYVFRKGEMLRRSKVNNEIPAGVRSAVEAGSSGVFRPPLHSNLPTPAPSGGHARAWD